MFGFVARSFRYEYKTPECNPIAIVIHTSSVKPCLGYLVELWFSYMYIVEYGIGFLRRVNTCTKGVLGMLS